MEIALLRGLRVEPAMTILKSLISLRLFRARRMVHISVDNEVANGLLRGERSALGGLCPFGAIEADGERVGIGAACKMCLVCVRDGPEGLFRVHETGHLRTDADKTQWHGIAVYVEQMEGRIHPVSLELIGKAKELAGEVGFPVYALLMGDSLSEQAEELLHYGVDKVYLYDYPELGSFLIEPYANVFEDFIHNVKPSSVLVGATVTGRSLAPRVAARLRTGLTADCTKLEMKENTDLVQIRPAFGGNIMAEIVTAGHRPQMATVRYKIFDAPARQTQKTGQVVNCGIPQEKLTSRIKVVATTKKEKKKTISDADVIVAVGRGVKSEKDLAMARELAELLGAEIAATRPLIEAGWTQADRQIGLSGRTVKPKLIITLGISGSVQFRAGMENSGLIISINTNAGAEIFNASHYAATGDIYDVVPELIRKIREGAGA